MGVLNYENANLTGENYFLQHSLCNWISDEEELVVLDIGANEGDYACKIKGFYPKARIYAFEPHPKTYKRLKSKAVNYGFEALQLACGREEGQIELYDYSEAGSEGTSHASLYKSVIEEIHKSESKAWTVPVISLDCFIKKHELETVHLLKIDTEGHELSVIHGAQHAINTGIIGIIQFEFNEMNVVSRTFFKDFFDVLPNYKFFRMLPDGLVSLGSYIPATCELFAFQNVVAIPCSMLTQSGLKRK